MKRGRRVLKSGWFTRRKAVTLAAVILIALAFLYYEEKSRMMARPTVTVAQAEARSVPVYLDYVGSTSARRKVELRARVEGFLAERIFNEGDDVKKGDLMYVIDPKPFEAALAEAQGRLAKDKASLKYAAEQVERYKDLVKKDYVSREEYDNLVTTMEQAASAVESSRAAVTQAELNLGYCRIYAPFDGRAGRTLVNTGNLVGKGEATKLATVVELDPIYVYFAPSDEDLQRIVRDSAGGGLKVELSFSDGSRYPHSGTTDFVDNQADRGTATVTMRATVPNPDGQLLPGIYLNARLYLDEDSDAVLVPEKALAVDQAGQYVTTVGPDKRIGRIYVESGAKYDGMRAITSGLSGGERVVVEGLQMVRPGMVVNPVSAEVDAGMQSVVKRAVLGR